MLEEYMPSTDSEVENQNRLLKEKLIVEASCDFDRR
jgi:hypothetical protein